MSARTPFRGMSPPSLGQGLVIAAAVCAAWIIWTESRERGWIPGLAPPAANAVDQSRKADAVESFDRPSVAQLIVDLSNPIDPGARRVALLKLSSIGPAAIEAIDAIRERLKDDNAGVRYVAVLALWRVSQDPEAVLPELPAMMEDDDRGVREVTADTLEAIGRPATGLVIKMLHSDSPVVRSRALLVLQRIVYPATFPEVSEAIESLSQDPNPDVRTEALVVCVDWGIDDKSGIRNLLRTDHTVPAVRPGINKDRNSREVALDEIAWLGPEAADLVPDLIALLEDYPELVINSNRSEAGNRVVQVRTLAPRVNPILRTLSDLKTVARPALPYLLGRLKDLEPWDGLAVVGTLVDIGADPEVLTHLVSAALSKSNRVDAWKIGRLLVRADPPEARRQVSLLLEKFANPNQPIDWVALDALRALAPKSQEAVPVLISLLDRGAGAAYDATAILGELGPDAAPAVQRLIAMLDQRRADGTLSSSGETFRALGNTFRALGNIGPAAESAVPLLLALLNDSKQAAQPGNNVNGGGELSTYHDDVISALGKIATNSPEVVLAIRRQLTNKSALRRTAALRALPPFAKNFPEVLPEIVEILRNDTVGNVRANSALAIAAISGDRLQALAPLTAALEDSDPNVRKMAAIALGSMGPAAKSALPALGQAWVEARCGMPSIERFALSRDYHDLRQGPLAQVLRRALTEIDRTE